MDIRPELPEMPKRVAMLRTHRGYPVPWFVGDVDGEPDFRVIRPGGIEMAWVHKRCWVCGQSTGKHIAFVIGPMCAVNRVSAEPPSHVDCADFAARACPFLSRPHMTRREGGIPEDANEPAGIALKRNPGVALVWITQFGGPRNRVIKRESGLTDFLSKIELEPHPFPANDGILFHVGEPSETRWYAEGRAATREEVMASIDSGMPLLEAEAEIQDGAIKALRAAHARALELVPA